MSNFEKVKMQSPNITAENIKKIGEMFPEVLTEAWDEYGYIKKVINFDKLKQILSDHIVDGKENYEFTWVGKRNAIMEAGRPTTKTLRPKVEDSVNWDTTENIYIEGDNLEALKILQESYLGKIKMIYIDPPYNTGNDFVYRDDFKITKEECEEQLESRDVDGNFLYKNTSTDARYHSNWMNMIYPRLKLARNLLKNEGAIFISIDSNEAVHLKKICDEIFGENNFIAQIANINNPKGRSDDKFVATSHESLFIYAKSKPNLEWFGFEPGEEIIKRYNKIDDCGKKYREIDLRKTGNSDLREDRPKMFYYFHFNEITKDLYPSYSPETPEGYICIEPLREDGRQGRWRWGIETTQEKLSSLVPKYMPTRKIWGIMEKDFLENRALIKPVSSWNFKDVNSERGTEEFISLGFKKEVFQNPKPLGTIKRCLKLSTSKDDVVLDFFSGSGTTAQAVMELNLEDKGNRKFIMIQLPEIIDEKSEAYRAGYKDICEIGKERIKRAGEKIFKEKFSERLDVGFKVFKVEESNMKSVYYTPSELGQQYLFDYVENIKEGRTSEDLLYQVMLSLGMELSLHVKKYNLLNCEIFDVDNGSLIACFAESVTDEIVRSIASKEPLRAVFKESSFENSSAKINLKEIFKELSPYTKVKVI